MEGTNPSLVSLYLVTHGYEILEEDEVADSEYLEKLEQAKLAIHRECGLILRKGKE